MHTYMYNQIKCPKIHLLSIFVFGMTMRHKYITMHGLTDGPLTIGTE